MTRSRLRTVTASVLAGFVVPSVLTMGPASAAPSKWDTFRFEYGPQVSRNFCGVSGLTIQQQGVAVGRERTTSRGPDGLPYYSVQEHLVDTWTNLETGESMAVVGAYRGGSLRVTDNGDGTLTVLVQNTGNTVYYSPNGEVIARDAGVFRFQLLFDHGGSPTDPSDDEFVAFLGVVKNAGLNADFCAAIVQGIG